MCPPFAVLFMMNFNLFYFVNTWSVVFYHFLIVLLIDLLIHLPWIVPDSFFIAICIRHLLGLSEVFLPHEDRQLFSSYLA